MTLMYDAERRCVAVKSPVREDANFFRVKRYGRGRRMRIVRAARMLKQFGIEVERTLVFCNTQLDEYRGSPMLLLPLDGADPIAADAAKDPG